MPMYFLLIYFVVKYHFTLFIIFYVQLHYNGVFTEKPKRYSCVFDLWIINFYLSQAVTAISHSSTTATHEHLKHHLSRFVCVPTEAEKSGLTTC